MKPRERGRQYGSTLGDYVSARAATDADVRTRVARVERRVAGAIESAIDAYDRAVQDGEAELGRLAEAEHRYTERAQARDASPESFDVARGLLYGGCSLLLVLADLSILAYAFAQFYRLPWYDDRDQSLLTLFVTHPLEMVRQFPELVFLSMGVLVIGLYVKAWRDVVTEDSVDGGRRTRARRVDLTIAHVALGLTLLSIVAASVARYEAGMHPERDVVSDTTGTGTSEVATPVSPAPSAADRASPDGDSTSRSAGGVRLPEDGRPAETSTVAATVAAIFGVALPLVSAAFFMRGYDALFNATRVWLAGLARARARRSLARSRRIVDARARQLADLRARRDRVLSDDYLIGAIDRATVRMDEGYAVGVTELLETARKGGVYAVLRPLAIRAATRGRVRR